MGRYDFCWRIACVLVLFIRQIYVWRLKWKVNRRRPRSTLHMHTTYHISLFILLLLRTHILWLMLCSAVNSLHSVCARMSRMHFRSPQRIEFYAPRCNSTWETHERRETWNTKPDAHENIYTWAHHAREFTFLVTNRTEIQVVSTHEWLNRILSQQEVVF